MNESGKSLVVQSEDLSIICPECGAENSFGQGEAFTCQKCLKPLTGKGAYSRFAKAYAAMFILLGGTGAWVITEFTGADRYPILTEHAIMETCIDGSNRPRPLKAHLSKRERCACALERVQEDFDADGFDEKKPEFRKAFSERLLECGKKSD